MAKLKSLATFLLYFLLTISTINAYCVINSQNGSPLFVKNFGTKKIILRKELTEVRLSNSESINVSCNTGLSLKTDYQFFIDANANQNNIELECRGNNLFYNTASFIAPKSLGYSRAQVSCESYSNALYESNRKLRNCNNYASYAIGALPTKMNQLVIAAICYDLENLQAKYVNYKAYQAPFGFFSNEDAESTNDTVTLDLKLDGFNTIFKFMSQKAFNDSYYWKKSQNVLLRVHDFDFVSLVQDSKLQADLREYENMFNIIWWRNLRLGNWLYYLQALEERTKSTKYEIYTGTSGVLTLPAVPEAKPEAFTIEAENIALEAPEYIWAYLKSIDDEAVHEEFVIVAYNSPFYSIDTTDRHICPNICHEISWLADHIFGKTHSMPALGLIHCCRLVDVVDKLDNFPLNTGVAPPPTTTTESNIREYWENRENYRFEYSRK